jgi:hypothetical protein
MFQVTRWCVVPYEHKEGRLARGEALQCYTKEEALREAARRRRRAPKVEVWEVTGWPVQDLWDRPRRLG